MIQHTKKTKSLGKIWSFFTAQYTGIEKEPILKALGIENAVYEEASVLWAARMQEDKDFVIIT
ncbi:MAG: hypothetical protein LBF27_18010, partial [Sphingobacterium sp.]|nr:hypothetical protein [Sphingobacterium sp.]